LRRSKRRRLIIALGVIAALAAILVWRGAWSQSAAEPVGLFTTLPILWTESDDIGEMLRGDAPAHWARGALEARGKIVPLDQLGGSGAGSLADLERVVIAQPRPLSPQENVALDEWVKGGGRLLLLADPMLTAESAFSVGDRRRPQDVVLLSPILARWGLELGFDETQALGETRPKVMDVAVPVNLPGRFAVSGANGACRIWGEGVAVTCVIGKGRVLALADAAVLDSDDPDGARADAFAWLLDAAFAAR
jgi:hypothetical protein